MNLSYQELIPDDFDDSSKVWIYQSSRAFEMSEAQQIEAMLDQFVAQWLSHGEKVKGYGMLLFGQFIVLMADESATGVSGCSTDSSVRIIKQIEERFKVLLFDRQTLAFAVGDRIQLIAFGELNQAAENNLVNAKTLYFNNTVLTKKEMLQKWIIPIEDSWLSKRITFREFIT